MFSPTYQRYTLNNNAQAHSFTQGKDHLTSNIAQLYSHLGADNINSEYSKSCDLTPPTKSNKGNLALLNNKIYQFKLAKIYSEHLVSGRIYAKYVLCSFGDKACQLRNACTNMMATTELSYDIILVCVLYVVLSICVMRNHQHGVIAPVILTMSLVVNIYNLALELPHATGKALTEAPCTGKFDALSSSSDGSKIRLSLIFPWFSTSESSSDVASEESISWATARLSRVV